MRSWDETLRNAKELLDRSIGRVELFQQWRCAHCNTLQTMGEPNLFYTHGICERCDHLTDMTRDGHDFAIVATRSGRPRSSKTSN